MWRRRVSVSSWPCMKQISFLFIYMKKNPFVLILINWKSMLVIKSKNVTKSKRINYNEKNNS